MIRAYEWDDSGVNDDLKVQKVEILDAFFFFTF